VDGKILVTGGVSYWTWKKADGIVVFFSDESRLTLYGLRSLATPAFAIYDVCIQRFEGFQCSFAVSKDDACCVWVPSPRKRLKHLMMFPNRN
jgi:hypothetical protein